MDFQIASHQSEGYQISTEVYSGPLDLLLQLIEKAELDITKLALAQVTDQYLGYLHDLQEQNAAEVSAFLVIAARLLQIKSAALLPRPVSAGQPLEEDPGEALALQLLLYKRFKELSQFLEQREIDGLRTYLRLDSTPRVQIPTKLDISELTLEELVSAARDIFGGQGALPPLSQVVSIPRITIRQKINAIVEHLRTTGSVPFFKLIQSRGNRLEIVVTFLAMLELIKRHIVAADQNTLFGEIELQSEGEWGNVEDQELEFE
ncbi:Segregation and condensation protein A [bioreactor metagenome]|uniref:Segregation and condensation protein A n=1 Tax=bioreactor metagenome TaxID=1076179 RepID=A0A644Z270_9ZZZZ